LIFCNNTSFPHTHNCTLVYPYCYLFSKANQQALLVSRLLSLSLSPTHNTMLNVSEVASSSTRLSSLPTKADTDTKAFNNVDTLAAATQSPYSAQRYVPAAV
jgi:hypothetical protein